MALTTEQIALILACMDEVNLTKHEEAQRELYIDLSKKLRRKDQEMYAELVKTRAFRGICRMCRGSGEVEEQATAKGEPPARSIECFVCSGSGKDET
jgi:hypothetical protein